MECISVLEARYINDYRIELKFVTIHHPIAINASEQLFRGHKWRPFPLKQQSQ